MIFQLSKSKNEGVRPVESETLQRWRELSKSETLMGNAAAESLPVDIEPTWNDQFSAQSAPTASQPQVPAWSLEESLDEWRKAKTPSSTSTPVRSAPTTGEQDIRSALGPGTVIEGKLRFDAPVRIDGNLIGEVTSSSMLVVGEQAVVKAIVSVGTLVVRGQVTGQVEAADKVEIKEGGILEANVKTKQLVIDEGGFFRGGCNTQ